MKWYYYILITLSLQHCASVSYVEKHQLKGDIKSLTTETFEEKNGKLFLMEKTNYTFTKNGRIKYSETFDADNTIIEVAEKKLWFIKRSYTNKEPYYCKTRWKPKDRERISCYTQKQYKQNEAIYHYNINGSILKIEDNFETFYTHFYQYDYNGTLSKIIIKNSEGAVIDEIVVTCKQEDSYGNCNDLEKKSLKDNIITRIISTPTYYK